MSDEVSVEASTPVAANNGDAFGSDELGQLQRILIGDHARQTNERIDTLEKALLGALSDLSAQVKADFKAVSKRIDSETETREQAAANAASRMETESNASAQARKQLKTDLDSSFQKLTRSIDATSGDVRGEIDSVRSQMTAELEAAQADLDERKLDRGALAALLNATASEL